MKIDLAFTPFELEKKELEGKAVVVIDSLRTTSTMLTAFENECAGFIPVATIGTRALVAAREAEEVFIGAFLNLSAVCRRLKESGRDVIIACSGEKNLFWLEDFVC